MFIIMSQKIDYESNYNDIPFKIYHYPKRYRNQIKTGDPFIYYQGDRYKRENRYYFGCGIVGPITISQNGEDYYAEILNGVSFPVKVPIYNPEGGFFESLGYSKVRQKENPPWQNSIRKVSDSAFKAIIEKSGLDSDVITEILKLNKDFQLDTYDKLRLGKLETIVKEEQVEMQNKKLVLRIKSVGYRHIPNPYGEYNENKSLNPQTYQAYVDIKDIPDNFPMETNPREQKLNTKTAKSIKDSLVDESDQNFQLKNRGILLTAESVSYDEHKKEMVITMSDMTCHGNVDGGHTYKLIRQHKNEVSGPKYVKIEVITNSEEIFQELAAARNTSVQVQDKSIAELENKFFLLKDSMPETIVDEIAFKENDIKRIPVENIIAILSCFDISAYGENSQPVSAYSAKGTMIKKYLKYFKEFQDADQIGNPFHAMKDIIPTILDLYEHLECNIANYYVKGSKNGRFGSVKGVKTGSLKSELYAKKIEHSTPKGILLPIVAAFRTLVKKDKNTGYYVWKADPIKYLDLLGPDLVYSTIERSRTLGNNPNAAGKDAQHWKSLFFEVNNKYLNDRLAELDG
jgi:hypothetical protein